MHYDFAISCRTPIDANAGEIGETTRRLLEIHSRAGKRCVAFVGTPPEPNFTADCPHPVEIVHVVPPAKPTFDNLAGSELAYAHALFLSIDAFLANHSIRMIEFPDFQAEGWFFVHHNLVYRRIACVTVRLHGARFILDEDNAVHAFPPAVALLQAAERETIQRADHVLFAGDALKQRVLEWFPASEAQELDKRCRKIPVHFAPPPACAPDSSSRLRKVGYVGPLEYRLGPDLFVLNAVEHFSRHPESPLQIYCIGTDTKTAGGRSFIEYLRQLVPSALTGRFTFNDTATPASYVQSAAELDVFVLPARFASDSLGLRTALSLGRPVVVSNRGDLPEFARGCTNARLFDPLGADDWHTLFSELDKGLPPSPNPGPVLANRDATNVVALYSNLTDATLNPAPLAPLAIVIPHLNDVDNLTALLRRFASDPGRDRLEILVVDDGSPPAVWARLEQLCAVDAHVTLLRTPHARSGPFVARRIGVEAAKASLVAFVDADDYIETDRYLRYAQALAETPSIDVIVPAQRFFGAQTDVWLAGLKSKTTILNSAYTHTGIVARKSSVLRACSHADHAVRHVAHAEDWIFGASLLFTGARIIAMPECAYHYNRAVPHSRSRTRLFMRWQTTAATGRHFEDCIEEALVNGTLSPKEMRFLRRLSITETETAIGRAAARGNRVPWHTHLLRAFRSLAGDRRFRP